MDTTGCSYTQGVRLFLALVGAATGVGVGGEEDAVVLSSLEGFSASFIPDPLGRLVIGAMPGGNTYENSGVGESDKTSGTEVI